MNFKKYYIAISLLTISGLLLGLYLKPNENEIALMYMYDKQYDKAYKRYIKQYEKGDRSVNVVIPIAEIKQEYVQIDQAVEMIEEFIMLHPESTSALKYLANTYLNANRFNDYLKTLEKVNAINPDEKIIREMIKYYGMITESDREIALLEIVVKKFKPAMEDFLQLSYRYAQKKQLDLAAQMMDRFLNVFAIEKVEIEKMEFVLRILAYQDRADLCLELSKSYYKAHENIENMEFLASTLHDAGLYKQAQSLLNLLPTNQKSLSKIVTLRVNILLAQNYKYLAYNLLLVNFAAENLPRSLALDFLTLATLYEDTAIVDKFINSKYIDRIPEDELVALATNSLYAGQNEFVSSLIKVLGDKFSDTKKVFSTFLAILDSNFSVVEKHFYGSYYDLNDFSNLQYLNLAGVYNYYGDFFRSREIMQKIDNIDLFSKNELEQATQLFLNLKLAQNGFDIINAEYISDITNEPMERAWILLATGVGNEDVVLNWVNDTKSIETIKDAFEIAYTKSYASLSLNLAKIIYEIDKTSKSKISVAKAYLLNGYIDQAYELLNDLMEKGFNVLEPYVQALIIKSKEDEKFIKILKEVVLAITEDNKIAEKKKRQFAHKFIDHEMKDEAAEIFFNLAENKKYSSGDVNMLLWLWEDNLDDEKVLWISKRAKSFEGAEKAKWLQYLVWNKYQDKVIDLVNTDELESDEIADVYIEALIGAKEKEKVGQLLAYLIPEEGRLPRLRKYGKLSYEQGLVDIAQDIYKRVLIQESTDQTALLHLSEIAFSKADYRKAKKYIKRYFNGVEKNFIADYMFAEIMKFCQRNKTAKKYYCSTIKKIDSENLSESYPQSVKANSLHQIGNDSSASKLYKKILKQEPGDLSLKADFANFLLDIGCSERAKKILFCEQYESNINVDIAKLRYFKHLLHFKEAYEFSNCLLKKYPNDHSILAIRADLENALGKWSRSFSYINSAISYQPENQNYQKIRRDLLWLQATNIYLNEEYRLTGKTEKQYLSSLQITEKLNNSSHLKLVVDAQKIEVLEYSDIVDVSISKMSKDVYKSELNYIFDFQRGDQFIGSIYGADNVFGGGIHYLSRDYLGKTLFIVEYRKPNWDFTQTVVEYGSRDMASIYRNIMIFRGLEVNYTLSYNRYNLNGLDLAATSLANDVNVVYALQDNNWIIKCLGQGSYVSFSYNLDAESPQVEKTRIDPLGTPFIPLSISKREVHSASIFSSLKFFRCLTVEGYGGYSYDREVKGKCSPLYGAKFLLGDKKPFKGGLIYSHSSSTSSAGESVDSFMVDIYYAW